MNSSDSFCCKGCSAAYQIINKLGLKSYYNNRFFKKGERILKPEENSETDISEFVESEQKDQKIFNSIYLLVEGLHCGACVWLIENVLNKQKSVKTARVNLSNHRLYIKWQGDSSYGNTLVKLINNLGYKLTVFDTELLKLEQDKQNSILLKSLAVAGFAAGNIMLLSIVLWTSNAQTMGIATRTLLHLVSALIALPTIIYSGRIFFSSAYKALKARRSNMDIPISSAIILVTLISIFETFQQAEHVYFDSAIMLVFFLLIGRYLDFSTRRKALNITGQLMLLSAQPAVIIDKNQKSKTIPAKQIKKGMNLLVSQGQRIAADGIVIKGSSEIDTSLISGESLPQKVKKGSEVFAGTVNLGQAITVEVNKSKDQTLLANIVKITEELESKKNGYLLMADKIARYYTPAVHIIAAITFILWYFILNITAKDALLNAAAVLIITCPCALALAVPVVQIVAAANLIKRGILLKKSGSLEKLADIKAAVFDKTGTLTLGQPVLIKKQSQIDQKSFKIAASIAAKSNHPLAKALSLSYKGAILDLKVKEIAGKGMVAEYKGKVIKMGRKDFVLNNKINIEDDNRYSKIYFQYDGKLAIFAFKDTLRQDAGQIISKLKAMSVKIILLSGDVKPVVKDIALKLKIKEYYFEVDPVKKYQYLQSFKSRYGNVLMVGDGLNDAPSLIAADVSISPSKANDITKNAADIIFQGLKLKPVLESLLIAGQAKKLMKQNMTIALLYNITAIPFAMAGYITPLIAAIAMSCSSIAVVLNSIRIKTDTIRTRQASLLSVNKNQT